MNLIKKSALVVTALIFLMTYTPAPAMSEESATDSKQSQITEHSPELLSTPPKDLTKNRSATAGDTTAKKVGWALLGLLVVIGVAAVAGSGSGGGGGGGGGDDNTGEITVGW